MTLIINTSITTGKFPTKWKQAKVTPIYKKGDRKTKENYRPVALLSVSAMILEKVVAILSSSDYETWVANLFLDQIPMGSALF